VKDHRRSYDVELYFAEQDFCEAQLFYYTFYIILLSVSSVDCRITTVHHESNLTCGKYVHTAVSERIPSSPNIWHSHRCDAAARP